MAKTEPKPKIIAIYNRKGGVGKTMLSVVLTDALVAYNERVLLIDLDEQGDATSNFLSNKEGETEFGDYPSVVEFMSGKIPTKDCIVKTRRGHIIPADDRLVDAADEGMLAGLERMYGYSILKDRIDKIAKNYDYIILDMPPAYNFIVKSALVAATGCIIPTWLAKYSWSGVVRVLNRIDQIKKDYASEVEIYGVVVNNYDDSHKREREFLKLKDDFEENIGVRIFDVIIPQSEVLRKTIDDSKRLFTSKKNTEIAVIIKDLLKEMVMLENMIYEV